MDPIDDLPSLDSVPEPQAAEPLTEEGSVNQMAVLLRLSEAFEHLSERLAHPRESTDIERFERMMDTLSGAMARVSQSNLEGAKIIAEESRQAHRPSNQVVPNRSVFNRRGEKFPLNLDGTEYIKPRLKCTMMIPWLVENESATREEVELLNLLEPGQYQIKRNDGTRIVLTCLVDYKADMVTPSRLVLNHETAFNNSNHRMMPPLVDMLRQMLRQLSKSIKSEADSVLTDEEEMALIEAGELLVSV